MNLIEISNELKMNFSYLLNKLPLNKIEYKYVDIFIRFYKKLFLKLYKYFGLSYATFLALNVGSELLNQISTIDSDTVLVLELETRTRSILENMEAEGKIDHSKHSFGISGEFYDSLTTIEKEIYLSTFLDNIVGPKEHLIINISKTCLRLEIGFEEYLKISSSISKKHQEWYESAKKNIIGYQIKF